MESASVPINGSEPELFLPSMKKEPVDPKLSPYLLTSDSSRNGRNEETVPRLSEEELAELLKLAEPDAEGNVSAPQPGVGRAPLVELGRSSPRLTWLWVKIEPPGIGPQVLVHVSFYQGSILGTYS